MTAAFAIQQSIRQDEIVVLPYSDGLAGDLFIECDGCAERPATDISYAVIEYWGKTEDGFNWRVHLVTEEG